MSSVSVASRPSKPTLGLIIPTGAILPPALPQAVIRGLAQLPTTGPLEPGKHRVHGTVTMAIDVWLTKGAPTSARESLPKADILALALERCGLEPAQLADLVRNAGLDVLSGCNYPTPAADACLEPLKARMDRKPREGSTQFAGEVRIAAFAPAAEGDAA